MSEVTVQDLAETVGMTADVLLDKMQQAGLPHSKADETVSDEQRQRLLAALGGGDTSRRGGGGRITLKRRSHTTLKTRTGTGKVDVQVKKTRTYVRRSPPESPARPEVSQRLEQEEAQIRELEQKRIDAQKRMEEEKRQAEEERQRKAEEEAARREAEEAAKREAEEAERLRRIEAERAAKAGPGDRAGRSKVAEPAAPAPPPPVEKDRPNRRREAPKRSEKGDDRGRGGRRRIGGKDLDQSERRRGKQRKHQRALSSSSDHGFQQPVDRPVLDVEVPDAITVGELAQRMAVKANEVIKTLMGMGEMVTINQTLEQETAALVVEEMGHRVKLVHHDEVEKELERRFEESEVEGERQSRAPVVTVMGHVDHGKTSLLDHIRKAKVAAGEAGGITQHIGAYQVTTDDGDLITFLDTPGHAAFTSMRARGAQLTDIVVLVVAADDGVMPQTEEAIQHARAAGVPIVVAVNKIDREDADPDRVRNELLKNEIVPEDFGGDTQFVNVSAITGQGIDELLEALHLQAEILELSAVYDAPARGVVIESQLDRGRGPVATLLVQHGRLHKGDVVVAGEFYGKVRAMIDHTGQNIDEAGPSMPVEILGLSGVPDAGDVFSQTEDDRTARELVEFRRTQSQERRVALQKKAKLDALFTDDSNKQVTNVIVKADVRGSLEALVGALQELGTDEVAVNVISSGVGGINENDANLALTSGATLIGFNVRADSAAKKVIEREGLELRYYSIIYELLDDVKAVLSGMLAPEVREEIVGIAEVREVFRSPKFGAVAGCMVTEGTVHRNKPIRVLRDNVVIFEGELESLRRFKDDVQEVRNGMECGIGVRGYNDVKPGDQIEVFDTREIERTL